MTVLLGDLVYLCKSPYLKSSGSACKSRFVQINSYATAKVEISLLWRTQVPHSNSQSVL
jgi:hypothetical protein